jgi:hypothetical protein
VSDDLKRFLKQVEQSFKGANQIGRGNFRFLVRQKRGDAFPFFILKRNSQQHGKLLPKKKTKKGVRRRWMLRGVFNFGIILVLDTEEHKWI